MKKNNIKASVLKAITVCVALSFMALVLPQAAWANTAANTVIRNTATVTYKDTGGNPLPAMSNTVDITIAYQCASPTLNTPTDIPTIPGTPANYSYTITSNSNGSDQYDLTAPTINQSAGITGSTVTFWQGASSITSVTLGATTVALAGTITAAGTTAISVPNDGAAGTSINGIEAGDTVVISGAVYTVASIVDNGTPVGGYSTITVNGNGTAQAITVGMLISERQSFTARVTPGTVSAASNQTIDVTISAIGHAHPCGAASDPTKTTVNVANLGITKEVSPDGSTWYTTGTAPQFAPGATVWYRITVKNNGSSNATVVTVTDPLPSYTTYVANSTLLNGITVNGDGGTSPLIAGLLVDDNSARAAGAVATGILPPYSAGPPVVGQAIVIYKVTII